MNVKETALSRIKRYPDNPRRNQATVAKVAASIKEFGFRQPIVVDAEGVIVIGDTRYLASQQLGLAKVPVEWASDLSPDQCRALRIADNRIGEDSAWDDDLLMAELERIRASDLDLGATGFEDLELAELLSEKGSVPQADPDDAPPVPEAPVSRAGDLWILGDHRIACGDSRSRKTVEQVLGKARPALMVTDPPYGVSYDPSWRGKSTDRPAAPGKGKGPALGKVTNDHISDWRQTWGLFPGKVAYIWHGGLHQAEVTASLVAVRFTLRAQIVWVKHRPAFSRGNFHWQHEPMLLAAAEDVADEELAAAMDAGAAEVAEAASDEGLLSLDHAVATYAVREGESADWTGGRKQSTVWFIEHAKSDTGHGTQKPVECMRRPMLNNSRPGDAVYEPFSGSGTSIIAAESCGRRCFAIELEPGYVDVAVRRWQTFTGREAKLEAKGRPTFEAVAKDRAAAAANEAAKIDPAAAPAANGTAKPRRRRRGS